MTNQIFVTEEGRATVVVEPEPVLELLVDAAPATDLVIEVPSTSLIVVTEQGAQGPPGPGGGGSGDITMADLEDHIDSPTPHPVYDEGPSLSLKYDNAKA